MLKNFAILLVFIGVFVDPNHVQANLNIKLDCGKSSASKYLTLSTPSTVPNNCRYTIKAKSSYVCQLRVDFSINLLPPTLPATDNKLQYAQCVEDSLQIGDFRLCGTETNQHIYIPFNRTAGDTQKDIVITTAARSGGTTSPSWNIRVTQLECSLGSPLRTFGNRFGSFIQSLIPESLGMRDKFLGRTFFYDGFKIAPNGCTQYYPESTGTFTSFNYNNGQGVYPGNMKYAICFRRKSNTQSLILSAETFQIGSPEDLTGPAVDDTCYGQIETEGKSEDFLMIPQSKVTSSNLRGFYYCSNILNKEQVTSTKAGPLSIAFNADSNYNENVKETGFKFIYTVA